MSNLKNKSDILSLSAQTLHDNCLYTAVPHCAYYSCYQLFKHIWLYSMGKTVKELDSACSQTTEGSHQYLINEVTKYAFPKNTTQQRRDFTKLIFSLKKIRTEADYNDIDVTFETSNKAIQLSSQLIPILNKL